MPIQPADLAYRRRVLRTVSGVAVLLLLALAACLAWLAQIAQGMNMAGLRQLMLHVQLSCMVLIALALAALGAHLLARGLRIVGERRFPPRDVRSVRDIQIREGDDAVRLGRTSQGLGAALLLLAGAIAVLGWLTFGR